MCRRYFVRFAVFALVASYGAAKAFLVMEADEDAQGLSLIATTHSVLRLVDHMAVKDPLKIDNAIYLSVYDSAKEMTITDSVNHLLTTNSVSDITAGFSLNDKFGDVAYDEWKKLLVTRGGQTIEIYENPDSNVYDLSALFSEDSQATDAAQEVGQYFTGTDSDESTDLGVVETLREAEKVAHQVTGKEVSGNTGITSDKAAVLKKQKLLTALDRQAYKESLEEEREFLSGGFYQCQAAPSFSDGRVRHSLSMDEFKYARCPPGALDDNAGGQDKAAMLAAIKKRMQRLRSAICASKAKGWLGGNIHEGNHYKVTGYATFESSVWPKRKQCNEVVDEHWANTNAIGKRYRPDVPPRWMNKMVNKEANLEFRSIWKVASTAFPDYLRCRFNTSWNNVSAVDPARPGRAVAVAVRDPVARFVSAAGELLERAVNHWCPGGPCDAKDGFDVSSTLDKLSHQTTWFALFKDETNVTFDRDLLHSVVRAMVSDTGCNYYTYAAEHLSSQTSFLAQNSGEPTPVSVLVKLNEDNAKPLNMKRIWQASSMRARSLGNSGGTCSLQPRNVQSDKPNGDKVPHSSEFFEVLQDDPFLLRDLCLIYAQDFVCFNFTLPDACKGMF